MSQSTDGEKGVAARGISHDAVVAVVTNLWQSPATDLCCDDAPKHPCPHPYVLILPSAGLSIAITKLMAAITSK